MLCMRCHAGDVFKITGRGPTRRRSGLLAATRRILKPTPTLGGRQFRQKLGGIGTEQGRECNLHFTRGPPSSLQVTIAGHSLR